ncbi:hypothetical protein GCM10027341_23870 [Spirosoma knui]
MRTTFLFVCLLALLIPDTLFGQRQLDVGIRLQKSIGLYTENGLTAQYTRPNWSNSRLYVGASYVTSRLGTALGSNAIKQDNITLFAAYYFRPQWLIQPLVKANIGYFRADYGLPLFDDLPRSSPLASPEIGLCFCPRMPLKVSGSIGYNLLTGNGVSGPGTLYPVFVQTSITWNLLNASTNHP